MSESGLSGAGESTVLVDPCPDEPAQVLDALIAAWVDADADELEPWRLTDSWRRDADGAWLLRAKLGKVAGAQVVGMLRALTSRHRSAMLLAGEDISHAQAAADAMVTLVDHYSSCGEAPQYGADRPRVLVNIDYDTLLGALGTATLLNTGDRITAREARRLACDAEILPIVMGGESVPLDVGREQRLFTSTLRQLVIRRDQGCAFPGCDRGPAECEVHHIVSSCGPRGARRSAIAPENWRAPSRTSTTDRRRPPNARSCTKWRPSKPGRPSMNPDHAMSSARHGTPKPRLCWVSTASTGCFAR